MDVKQKGPPVPLRKRSLSMDNSDNADTIITGEQTNFPRNSIAVSKDDKNANPRFHRGPLPPPPPPRKVLPLVPPNGDGQNILQKDGKEDIHKEQKIQKEGSGTGSFLVLQNTARHSSNNPTPAPPKRLPPNRQLP